MIQEIYSLVLEDTEQVLGVRIKTVDNKLFDLELDTFHKIIKMDVAQLEPLELIEYGDKLMTYEEFNLGTLVEDATENPKLLEQLKKYLITQKSENITDPKLLDKRRKKLFELEQAYWTYLPNPMLKPFAEYHITHFEGNRGLYNTLSDNQFNLIKQYSKWRSRLLFEERAKHTLLVTKPKKAEKLAHIMGSANDWQYDGVVDTGYRGGSHCELGHALRYEHYAYSQSTGKSIIFGQDCVADFFEIPPHILKEIVNAQEVILKEVKTMVFLINTGYKAEYEKEYLKTLSDLKEVLDRRLVKQSSKDYNWISFMVRFHEVGLPLPLSMRRKLKDYSDLLKDARIIEELEAKTEEARNSLINSPYNIEEISNILEENYSSYLQREVHILILNGKYTHPLVKTYFEMHHLLEDTLKHLLFTTGSKSRKDLVKISRSMSSMVKDSDRGVIRLASLEDRGKRYRSYSRPIISEKNRKTMEAVLNLTLPIKDKSPKRLDFDITLEDKQKDVTYFLRDEQHTQFLEYLNTLRDNIDFLTSEQYIKEVKYYKDDAPQINTIEQSLQYATYKYYKDVTAKENEQNAQNAHIGVDTTVEVIPDATDKRTQTLNNMITEIEAVRNTSIINLGTFVYDVISTIKSNGRISEKQEAIIRKHFDMVVTNIETNSKRGVVPKTNKVMDIIETYRKYGNLSEKQLKFITGANMLILDSQNKSFLASNDDLPF